MYKPQQLARIEAGLCLSCGCPKKESKLLRCDECAAKARKAAKLTRGALYDRRKAACLCVFCGDPTSSSLYCSVCLKKKRKAGTQHYEKHARRDSIILTAKKTQCITDRVCLYCTAVTIPDTYLCVKHYTERQEYDVRRRAAAAQALLCKCGKPKVGKTRYCFNCWCRTNLSASGMRVSLEPALIQKWEQTSGLCFYTRVPLTPGVNASIEHVVSRRREPARASDPCNIVWADLAVNRAKRDMTVEDFVVMCEAVVANKAQILAGVPH